MKKTLFALALLLAVPAAKAELLYFMADAETPGWESPDAFDFAMVGVSKYVDGAWTATWGADGSRLYLHLYDTMDSTLGDSSAATKAQVLADFGSYARGSDALDTTAVGWADVSGYLTDDYRFYIEVYADGKSYDFMEASQTYGQLLAANHIYAPGSTNPQPVTPWTVPEPASGLLLLVGAGLAAWRKRGRARRTLTSSFFLLTSSLLSAFAGADDTLVSFSTKGPDTYLDGTTVRDGECYALVWTRSGASFEGLVADGSAVGTNSRVVVFAPVAKNGHCPPVLFELDAELAKGYAGGAFAVYLLDTRLASGAVGGVKANGAPVAVNGWGAVSEVEKAGGGGGNSTVDLLSRPTFSISSRSALPANTPQPQITAIRLVGDNVYLTVKGTLPCLKYKAVDAVGTTASTSAASMAAQGVASPDEEITVIAPKKGASALYSVQRD